MTKGTRPRNVQRDLLVAKYGSEVVADARLAEEAKQDAVTAAMRKLTQSPTPARHLSGGGVAGVATMMGHRRIIVPKQPGGPVDWDMWCTMPTAMLWEAVALSLGHEPGDEVPADPAYFDTDYPKRLRIAEAHLSTAPGSALRLAKGLMGTPGATVSLPEFGAWAQALGWQLPAELPRAAPVPAEPSAGPVSAHRIKRAALIERHARQWPSIERDLKDASTNGLSTDAKAVGVGWWQEDKALTWATERGKLKAGMPVASVFTSTTHKIKG